MDGDKYINEVVKDDPKKPYKTYAAMLGAFLAAFGASTQDLPPLAVAAIAGLVAAIAVYTKSNPKKAKEKAPGNVAGDLYLGE